MARAPERAKKPSNNDLPASIDQKLWRPVFISTYMQWAATQPDPWDIPVKLACEKMQLIWDAIFPRSDYIVTSTSAVYLLVSMFKYTVQSINTIYRLFNGLQTHGVTLLGRLDFRLVSRTLSLKMTYGTLMRIELNSPIMHSMSSGSVTRRPAAMILRYDLTLLPALILTLLDAEISGTLSRRTHHPNL